MPRTRIRLLKGHEEFRECEGVQKGVWGTLGVSSEALTVTQEYGGAVIGAFVGKRLAGFIYAFLARRNGRLIHWSHMMAVQPSERSRGLGFRMKLAHRRLALERGIKSICWTYDPLQSRNAALNIGKLGATVEEYIADCYGNFPSRIESGLASDRFVVDWRIASSRVERRLCQGNPRMPPPWPPRVNTTRPTAGGFLENVRIFLNLDAPRLMVEIPANTDQMRARALPLAERWRLETRRIFQRYFDRDYEVAEFVPPRSKDDGAPTAERGCFYILRRTRP